MVIEFYDKSQDEKIGFICSLLYKTINTKSSTLYSYKCFECFEVLKYKELLYSANEFYINKVKFYIDTIEIKETTDYCLIEILTKEK